LGDAPEFVFARIVSAVDAGRVTVLDAVALPVNFTAYPPEAVRSETTLPAVVGATVIRSASTVVVLLLVVVAAATGAAEPLRSNCSPVARSRRAVPSISASAASAGAAGVGPVSASEIEDSTVLNVVSIDAVAIGGDTTDTGGGTAGTTMAGIDCAGWTTAGAAVAAETGTAAFAPIPLSDRISGSCATSSTADFCKSSAGAGCGREGAAAASGSPPLAAGVPARGAVRITDEASAEGPPRVGPAPPREGRRGPAFTDCDVDVSAFAADDPSRVSA